MVWGHKDFVRELHRQLVEIETLRRKLSAGSGDAASGDAASGDAASGDAASGDVKNSDVPNSDIHHSDAKSSLGKLEESQHQLLRKIDELFTADVEIQVSGVLHGKIDAIHKDIEDGGDAGLEHLSKDGDEISPPKPPMVMDAPPEYLLACLQSMLRQPGALQHLVSFGANPQVEQLNEFGAGTLDVADDDSSSILQQRCCGCGKLLVSSLLAGEQIIQEEDEWYHEGCHPSHDPLESEDGDILWQPSVLN
jgi:hypothetical protein